MNILIDGYAGSSRKKTNFSQVMTDEILAALELINQRLLKIHHQQTAIERFR
ncbi:putative transposase IS1070, partial [Latilactobacillus curvatus]